MASNLTALAPLGAPATPIALASHAYESEAGFQAAIVTLARLSGWLVFHPFDSRHSTPGWPDLALCRDGRLILAEVKTARGRVSPAQRRWLEALAACPGVEAHTWRPQDWPAILETLTRTPATSERLTTPEEGGAQ